MINVVHCVEFGGPEKLQVNVIEAPPIAADEVRYAVEAFALNRADLMFMFGEHYTVPTFPSRIGQEAAGVVTEVGADVTKFQVGDRVTAIPFHTLQHGVQGDSAITPERYVTTVPAGLEAPHATSIWMQYLTPWFAFAEATTLTPGQTVLITAAASSAGLGAVQIASMLGLRSIATIRTPEKEAIVRAQGATDVVVVGRDNLAQAVQRVSEGAGIAAAFDPIGGDSLHAYSALLAHGAIVFGYGTLSDVQPVVPIADMVRAAATFHPYSMFNHVVHDEQLQRAITAIKSGLEAGTLKPVIDRVFPFTQLIDAYRYMETNKQIGKIVVEVAPGS